MTSFFRMLLKMFGLVKKKPRKMLDVKNLPMTYASLDFKVRKQCEDNAIRRQIRKATEKKRRKKQ